MFRYDTATLPRDAKPATIYRQTIANGGYTVDPVTGAIPTTGFQVGAFPNSNPRTLVIPKDKFTARDITKFMKQNEDVLSKPHMHVGAWWDKDGTNNVYLDVSEHVDGPTGVRLATKKGELQKQTGVTRTAEGNWPKAQEAIFDNKTFEVLPVGNFWEFANSPEMRARMDELHAVGHQVMSGKDWWNLYGGPLAEAYGEDKVRPLAGFLASTSPASTPDQNLRSATEYMRRLIKQEPIIQPDFRIPANAVGYKSGYNGPGKQMPMEAGRIDNLLKAAAGDLDRLQADKVNDMAHALVGDDVGVYDRRWAKLFEDWKSGVYAQSSKDKLTGSMVTGKLDNYATIENVVRDAAKRAGEPLNRYSAMVWEGIGKRIKDTGQLYGMPQAAHAIPPASEGFNNIFPKMVRDKAAHLGITVPEMLARLKRGDGELLGLVLTTAAGTAAFRLWLQDNPPPPDGPR